MAENGTIDDDDLLSESSEAEDTHDLSVESGTKDVLESESDSTITPDDDASSSDADNHSYELTACESIERLVSKKRSSSNISEVESDGNCTDSELNQVSKKPKKLTEQSLPHIEANLTINIEEVDDNETQCEHQLKNRYQYVKNDEIITHYKKSSNSNDDPSSEEGMIKEVGQSLRNGNPYKIPTPSPNFDYSYSTTSMEYYEPPFEDHLSNHTHSDDIPSNLSTELNTNSEHESVKIANKCSFCEENYMKFQCLLSDYKKAQIQTLEAKRSLKMESIRLSKAYNNCRVAEVNVIDAEIVVKRAEMGAIKTKVEFLRLEKKIEEHKSNEKCLGYMFRDSFDKRMNTQSADTAHSTPLRTPNYSPMSPYKHM